jgi:hypothetical protein
MSDSSDSDDLGLDSDDDENIDFSILSTTTEFEDSSNKNTHVSGNNVNNNFQRKQALSDANGAVAEGNAAVVEAKDADESDVNDPGTFLDEYLFITHIQIFS